MIHKRRDLWRGRAEISFSLLTTLTKDEGPYIMLSISHRIEFKAILCYLSHYSRRWCRNKMWLNGMLTESGLRRMDSCHVSQFMKDKWLMCEGETGLIYSRTIFEDRRSHVCVPPLLENDARLQTASLIHCHLSGKLVYFIGRVSWSATYQRHAHGVMTSILPQDKPWFLVKDCQPEDTDQLYNTPPRQMQEYQEAFVLWNAGSSWDRPFDLFQVKCSGKPSVSRSRLSRLHTTSNAGLH